MYSLMDAEYYASCGFFIVCLLVLNFWLLNILVAVITNTFAEIMDETKHSAFAVSSASVYHSLPSYLDRQS
jgi:regulatory protein YycI of two-component signal transduction system YycFG